ncbi:tRNA (adenosine(37)-N6)-threonylcarbamoyltransferase complex dimerization subunit type 1 TsaB [Gluconobacter sp. Gdi]|uniref:tRNA (adenosine(37)-N6)-threonylcarbamoyltransferase complex dimerization subunit type 1 TsaB n=1 Tax=unclassified Gluconobacter TaxID=2644261 RepID=UPI00175EBEEF|nr:tRNA (adenosine(37)-N6)-threonylcarbamoyltransferase complex dimerization subunit type 1 TsaB [Gluconobacter sp. Gdi]GFE96103.1 tRNA (adenosine(37)-N6)-threonylcarbamoyltransferase complex dimerization subunit type 1 TsaB [Gluconobacter sp. Gdi]
MSVRTVVFNGAGAGTGSTNLVALVEDGRIVAEQHLAGRGASEHFAPALRTVLEAGGWSGAPDRVVAVIGPGSFTGLRASLSLAAGLAAGWECPTIGVTLGAAIRATLGQLDVTCISVARRGRYFVDPPTGEVFAISADDLDASAFEVIAGDAVSERETWPCRVVACVAPDALGIVRAAETLPSGPLMPLYVDPPEAKPPAAGLRPLPQ